MDKADFIDYVNGEPILLLKNGCYTKSENKREAKRVGMFVEK